MKQIEDTLTIDMLEPLKPRRGRTRVKNPLTPAQRQDARRKRLAAEGQAFMTIQISVHILNKLAEIGVGTSINKNTYIEAILEAHLFGNDVVLGTNLAHLSDIAPVGCAAAVATDHTAQGAEAA